MKLKNHKINTIPVRQLETMIRRIVKEELHKRTNFAFAKTHLIQKQQLQLAATLPKQVKGFTSDFIKTILSNI
jgi:hypothetical protein